MAVDLNKSCACHVLGVQNEPIKPFTDISWAKVVECMEIWKNSDGAEREIALGFDPESREHTGFHLGCYQRFTGKRRLAQAEKRREKGKLRKTLAEDKLDLEDAGDDRQASSKVRHRRSLERERHQRKPVGAKEADDQVAGDDSGVKHVPPEKRSLRSNTGSSALSAAKRKSSNVLPPICMLCRREKRRRDPISAKRSSERLVSCETDGRTLIKAAEYQKDENLLLQLRGQDLVSIELKYHKSCYQSYVRCVTYTYQKKAEEDSGIMYAPSFKKFCDEVVQKRILDGDEVMEINEMRKIFIEMIGETENIDASTYKNMYLKRRLLKRFGDKIEFVRPHIRKCELVMATRENSVTVNQDSNEAESGCSQICL